MAAQDTTISVPSLRDLSVDELFQRHLVRLIQKLYAEYLDQVGQAKDDLHSLVGAKYRDLIRIAEEVDQMSLQSSQINSNLTDLSYRRSNHAQFGNCASSRFDAKMRLAKAQQARYLLQTTILNNVINNQIIGHDLKLRSNNVSSTASLVHLAKLYHTVTSVFLTTLGANPHMLKNFMSLRANFVSYLERKISSYCSNVPIGNLSSSNLILKQSDTWVEPQIMEFADVFDEDDLEDLADWNNLGLSSLGTGFVPQSLPIVNLLVAYLIVNCDTGRIESTEQLADRIIALRYQYFCDQLQSLNKCKNERIHDLNFLAIFSFIENTSLIIRKYLVGNGFLEIQSRLIGLKSWNPADLLGFHNWMDLRLISFPKDRYAALSQDFLSPDHSLLIAYLSYLKVYLPQIVNDTAEGIDGLGATRKLQILNNAIASLRKVEVLTLQVDMESMAVALVSQCQLIPHLQDVVLSSVEKIILGHQSVLISEIVPLLTQPVLPNSGHEPFTLEFVSTIDTDVGDYINGVIEVASLHDTLQSHHKSDTIYSCFSHWLAVQRSLLTLISTRSEIKSRLEKVFNKSGGETTKFGLWGGFCFDSVNTKFDYTSNSLKSSLLEKLLSFKQALTEHMSANEYSSDVEVVFFSLTLILILRKNLSILQLPNSNLEAEIDDEVEHLYKKAFDCLLSADNSLNPINVLSNQLITKSAYDSASIPTAPQMLVYSMMNHLASSLLHSEKFSESELYLLYSDEVFREKFVKVKNDWIRDNLVNKLGISQLDIDEAIASAENPNVEAELYKNGLGEKTTESDPTHSKYLIPQIRQLFANAVFLLQFTNEDSNSSSDTTLDFLARKFAALSVDAALDESVVENIVKSVTTFYQAGKETYMPLLLT